MFWLADRNAWKTSFSTGALHRLTVRLSQALAMNTSCPSSRPMLAKVPLLAPAASSWDLLLLESSLTTSRSPAETLAAARSAAKGLLLWGAVLAPACHSCVAARPRATGEGVQLGFADVPTGAKNAEGVVTSAGTRAPPWAGASPVRLLMARLAC